MNVGLFAHDLQL